jgi:glycosyltransferase involved in cell wall biosynthesis
MRIVVPTWTVDERKGGIRTFLCNLVDALARQPDVELTLLCSRDSRAVFEGMVDRCTLVDLAPPGGQSLRPLVEQCVGARVGSRFGDVLLTPSNVGLLAARIPQVVVVQSPLAVRTVRESHPTVPVDAVHRAYHRMMLGVSLRRADAVVTVTEWMRGQLVRSVPRLDGERVHVVPEGVALPAGGAPRPVRSGPPRRLLFVSTIFPYKGAGLLVDALGHLRAHHPDLDWSCRIVGRDPSAGVTSEALRSRIEAFRIGDRVNLVGPVSHERVWEEYAGADVFIYPSQLESFGLPPLEAMAVGVPVIASTAPSVREVVGDAARVVDVTDPEGFATTIAELLTSDSARRELRQAGDQLVARRTWDAAAERLVTVLRRASDPHPSA